MNPDVSRAFAWRKSSRSGNNGGQCVELAETDRQVAIRDSKNPGQGHFTVSRAQFRALTEAVKTDRL